MRTEPADELLAEMRGPVMWLTINREDKRNSLNPPVLAGLTEALANANRNRGARCGDHRGWYPCLLRGCRPAER